MISPVSLEFKKDDQFKISLDVFEGPLDVLLEFVKEEKVAIWDISISKITNSYLEYIRQMQALDLEISSEFLEMAAFLIELKSKMLLPADNPNNEELLAEAEQEKAMLLARLIEYKSFKNLTGSLIERENFYAHVHTREAINAECLDAMPIEKNIIIRNASVELLVKAFQRIWADFEKRANPDDPYYLSLHTYPIKEKMHEIVELLKDSQSKMLFSEFFKDINDRSEIIATFIGILELVRQQLIVIAQTELFDDIEIAARTTINTEVFEFDDNEYNQQPETKGEVSSDE